MESDAPAPLLSLTGAVEDILLPFVSAGEGGVQSVLNLREVCSTTKMWVDTLQPLQAKRIFSSRKVEVELSVESLEEFLAAPPPSGVTSLCLTQTDSLNDDRFPPEKEELRNRFVSFWLPKLESLKVDVLFLPLNLNPRQLLSCASLRSFHCQTIKHNGGKPTGLPESLFRFETLRVGSLEMGVVQKREFFSRLSTQKNLKHLILNIEDAEDLAGLVDLIESKRTAEDFKLSFNLDPSLVAESGEGEPEEDRLKALYVRLATSVENSSAAIRIWGISEVEIVDIILEEVERGTVPKFFRSIFGMSYSFLTASNWGMTAADYPNLETYTMRSFGDYAGLRALEATAFPRSLKKLQVDDGFPRPSSLPSTLTHVVIDWSPCSINELLQWLFSLAEECPSLKNLEFCWDRTSGSESESDSSFGVLSFATSPQFKGLKSLDIRVIMENEFDAAVCRMILLHGFKIPQLTLRDLKLSFVYTRSEDSSGFEVDHNLLIALITGPISKSLLNVDIDPSSVAEDARPLLDLLKSTAAENKRKHVAIYGKERERQFNR